FDVAGRDERAPAGSKALGRLCTRARATVATRARREALPRPTPTRMVGCIRLPASALESVRAPSPLHHGVGPGSPRPGIPRVSRGLDRDRTTHAQRGDPAAHLVLDESRCPGPPFEEVAPLSASVALSCVRPPAIPTGIGSTAGSRRSPARAPEARA